MSSILSLKRCISSQGLSNASDSKKHKVDKKNEDLKDDLTPFSDADCLKDASIALQCLKACVTTRDCIPMHYPVIVFKHQLYSLICNRTLVDRQLSDLRSRGVIRMFKLGAHADEFAILTTKDYTDYIKRLISKENASSLEKFIQVVLPTCTDVSTTKELICNKLGLTETDISYLMNIGSLTIRDVDTWWIAIPNAGQFMKHFLKGRDCVVKILRKRKYQEILKQELEKHPSLQNCGLGACFQIHDIIGKDVVKCISTTSGTLLRLNKIRKRRSHRSLTQ